MFLLHYNEPFIHSYWVLFYSAAPPYFYSSPELTNQTGRFTSMLTEDHYSFYMCWKERVHHSWMPLNPPYWFCKCVFLPSRCFTLTNVKPLVWALSRCTWKYWCLMCILLYMQYSHWNWLSVEQKLLGVITAAQRWPLFDFCAVSAFTEKTWTDSGA